MKCFIVALKKNLWNYRQKMFFHCLHSTPFLSMPAIQSLWKIIFHDPLSLQSSALILTLICHIRNWKPADFSSDYRVFCLFLLFWHPALLIPLLSIWKCASVLKWMFLPPILTHSIQKFQKICYFDTRLIRLRFFKFENLDHHEKSHFYYQTSLGNVENGILIRSSLGDIRFYWKIWIEQSNESSDHSFKISF